MRLEFLIFWEAVFVDMSLLFTDFESMNTLGMERETLPLRLIGLSPDSPEFLEATQMMQDHNPCLSFLVGSQEILELLYLSFDFRVFFFNFVSFKLYLL